MRAAAGFSLGLALVAGFVFIGVGLTELSYVSDHPYAYGPAKVIAWAAGGGLALAVAVTVAAAAFLRSDR